MMIFDLYLDIIRWSVEKIETNRSLIIAEEVGDA
jgi:hypothetical protein